jgi:hypothetical protein
VNKGTSPVSTKTSATAERVAADRKFREMDDKGVDDALAELKKKLGG